METLQIVEENGDNSDWKKRDMPRYEGER